MQGEGESPDMMLMSWGEVVPEEGTERKALDSLATLFCDNQLPFLERRGDTRMTERFKQQNHVATDTLL